MAGRKVARGPGRGNQPFGASVVAQLSSLRVSPNLEVRTLSGIPKVVRDRLGNSRLQPPSHNGFIFFPFPLLIPLIADVLIKPSNSCYAVLKGTYSSVNQAGLGGGSVGRRIKGRLTNHSGDHNNKIRGEKNHITTFRGKEGAGSQRPPALRRRRHKECGRFRETDL